ncbi:MAG: hypothetical protein K2X31_07285 [Sphingopyxis sp.]|nr:hypothetical protein [Sphingopyxis sp.]
MGFQRASAAPGSETQRAARRQSGADYTTPPDNKFNLIRGQLGDAGAGERCAIIIVMLVIFFLIIVRLGWPG